MAERDKIRELAEKLGDALCDEDGCYWNSNVVENILRAELKPLLDTPDLLRLATAIRVAADKWQELELRERPERGDYSEWIAKSVIEWLAAELQGWRKE